MATHPDTLARTCRALDHAANTATSMEARALFRAHHTFGVMLLVAMEDPTRLQACADEWGQLGRALVREATQLGIVDMSAHYAAERQQ